MNAYIYVRVSTAGQADAGVGADLQERACRQLCELRGWTVAGVWKDDGVTGTVPPGKRKGLVEIRKALGADPEGVVVAYDLKRLARRSRLMLELVDPTGEWRFSIACATQFFDTTTPMGRAVVTILAAIAELDWEEIRERNKRMQTTARARGARWGFPKMHERTVRDAEGKVRYEVDPIRVGAIRAVRKLYETGNHSFKSLADHLNQVGVPSVQGKRWHPRSIEKALKVVLPEDSHEQEEEGRQQQLRR